MAEPFNRLSLGTEYIPSVLMHINHYLLIICDAQGVPQCTQDGLQNDYGLGDRFSFFTQRRLFWLTPFIFLVFGDTVDWGAL